MAKRVIVFDLDGTLALSKSPVPDAIIGVFSELLGFFDMCVISGGKFEQFEKQVLANLKVEPAKLKNLHLMPTCGTRYYRFDGATNTWDKVYSEDLTAEQRQKIISELKHATAKLGFDKEKTWGEQIEDRGSQITFSALGQQAPVDAKEAWDPDMKKKLAIIDLVVPNLPEFEVRAGGTTSIDVTKLGIDKAYGMQKLMEQLKVAKEDILFFGDKLQQGGNDYPVKAMGIDTLEVARWEDTALALSGILHIVR